MFNAGVTSPHWDHLLGKPVKDFSSPSTGGGTFRLSEHRGKKLVLYFYPKDSTPGCTAEGADFRDRHAAFRKAGAEIVGSYDAIRWVPEAHVIPATMSDM